MVSGVSHDELSRGLFGHCPELPGVALAGGRAVVSATEVYGEFAPGVYESFRQTIIEFPVRYSDARFMLPAVAWVSAERSVVRGAVLGFNKQFGAQGAWSGSFTDRSRCQSMVRNGAWTRDRGAGYLGSF